MQGYVSWSLPSSSQVVISLENQLKVEHLLAVYLDVINYDRCVHPLDSNKHVGTRCNLI